MATPTKEELLNMIKEINKDPELKKAFESAVGKQESTFSTVDTAKQNAEELDMLKKRAQLQSDISKAKEYEQKAEIKRLQEIRDSLIANNDLKEDQKGLIDEMIVKLQEGQDISYDLFDIKELDDQIGKVRQIADEERYVNEARKEGRDKRAQARARDLADMVGINQYSTSTLGKFQDLFAGLADGSTAARGEAIELGRALAKNFNPQNIGLTVFNKIFSESMKTLRAYDNAVADLSKTTGTVDKFNNVLYDAQRAGNLLGVEMQNVGTAIAALNAGTSQFAKLNESTQTQLAISTSQFEKLGVSAQDTADFMENAFKIMNMGATEAIQVQKELAMAGVELGIGADKIVKDFNSASKTLAVYGKGSVKIFKDLAAQAKAAGVEVGTLLGIVQKFDTFSGAAEGAAKFNALLGTQLSTTQMLMMTEDERMKTLVESVQAQGIAFGDMDRFTQKAIASAAGISDMNEANRIFSMSLSDYEANAREMENNAAAQKKFDDAVQATVPTMKKFQNLATELITLVQPALEMLGDVADYLTDMFQGMSKETKETISMIALFVSGIMVLAPLFAVGGGFMAGLAAIGPAIAGVGTGIATAIAAISGVTMTGVGAGVLATLIAAGGGIAVTMAAMAASEADMAESNAKMMSQGSATIASMAEIGRADFSGIATKFRGVVEELNSMGTDVKVTSMMQNLSLISAGTAIDITGAKIAGSATNVTANVQNFFDGMHMVLEAGGQEFEAYVKTVAATTALQ